MGTKLHITSPQEYNEAVERSNVLLSPPPDLTAEEAVVWKEIAELIIASTHYKKTTADAELIRQYCQTKIMRDRAWLG